MATEAAQDAAAGAAAHGAEASAGMPQLDITTWSNQIFWLLVALVVIYFVLSRVALPKIGAVLAERSSTITNNLAAAEELKAKAVEAEKAYNEALAKARAEANRIVAEAKAEIQADLDAATECHQHALAFDLADPTRPVRREIYRSANGEEADALTLVRAAR